MFYLNNKSTRHFIKILLPHKISFLTISVAQFQAVPGHSKRGRNKAIGQGKMHFMADVDERKKSTFGRGHAECFYSHEYTVQLRPA